MAYTQTVFLLDISPSMAKSRLILESRWDPVTRKESKVSRTTTDFEWVNEWISKKLADEILTSTPTKRFAIMTYGGLSTNNIVHSEGTPGYEGVEEVWGPKPADIEMLELLRSMRARELSDDERQAELVQAGDPISALIVAIRRLTDENWIDSKSTRNRIIYLITGGRSEFDKSNIDELLERFQGDPSGRLVRDRNGIQLKIVGVDFDDPEWPYFEPEKSEVKAKNELWWHRTLTDLPPEQFQLVSAINVISTESGPTVTHVSSSALNSKLTLGDLERANQDDDKTLTLGVTLYKATQVARPMGQTLISKAALEKPSTLKRKQLDEKRMSQFLTSQSQSQTQLQSQDPSSSKNGNLNPRPYGDASTSGSRLGGNNINDDDDDEPSVSTLPTYRVSKQAPLYKEKDKASAHKLIISGLPLEKDETEPDPIQEDDPNLIVAYKLGKDHVEVERVDQFKLHTEAGLEILNFYYEEKFPTSLSMGEVSWVLGNDDASKIAISALAKTLRGDVPSEATDSKTSKQDSKSQKKSTARKVVLVRKVAKTGSPATLGILFCPKYDPYHPDDQNDVLCYVSVPMAQDFRAYPFDSLTSVTLKTGTQLKEHPRIPKPQQLQAMENLIDEMNLDNEVDQDGKPAPWFDVYESFNPAIHSLKAASLWRVMNPESPESDLPQPHYEIEKYLHSPAISRPSFQKSLQEAKTALGLRVRSDAKKSEFKRRAEEREQAEGDGSKKKRDRNELEDDSDTDEDQVMKDGPTPRESASGNKPVKDSLGDLHQLDLSDPIHQYISKFEEIWDGDSIEDQSEASEKLTEEMFLVIRKLIRDSKTADRNKVDQKEIDQVKGCSLIVREKATEWEMADKYNNFLKSLKKQLQDPLNFFGRPNRNIFWEKVFKGNRSLSLITEEEDNSELSELTEEESNKFVEIVLEPSS